MPVHISIEMYDTKSSFTAAYHQRAVAIFCAYFRRASISSIYRSDHLMLSNYFVLKMKN